MQSADKLQRVQKGLYIATAVALLTVGAYAQMRGKAEAKEKGGGNIDKLPLYYGPSAPEDIKQIGQHGQPLLQKSQIAEIQAVGT
jgi:hypothetical protein